jgi:hypothetical protein
LRIQFVGDDAAAANTNHEIADILGSVTKPSTVINVPIGLSLCSPGGFVGRRICGVTIF